MKQLRCLPLLLLLPAWKEKENGPAATTALGTADSVLATDAAFIAQKLLKGRYRVHLAPYIKDYCRPEKHDRQRITRALGLACSLKVVISFK